jgi:hypothetical protein
MRSLLAISALGLAIGLAAPASAAPMSSLAKPELAGASTGVESVHYRRHFHRHGHYRQYYRPYAYYGNPGFAFSFGGGRHYRHHRW